jgi:ABC-2 type transport system permease protein
MPVFDQGYQHWQGTLVGHGRLWLTITRRGVRAQMKNRWPRLVMLMAWFPALVLALVLIVWGLIEQKSELVMPLIRSLGVSLSPKLVASPEEFRVAVWSVCYREFFGCEVFFSMVLVLLVGPNLISQDLRFNALPLYFSRPLRRRDYFLGKFGVIAVFLGGVLVVPAVLAWVLGTLFSLNLAAVRDTFPIMLAAVGSGLVVILSAGTLMLALSSLSRNSRYVAAFWVGVWFVSASFAAILRGLARQPWCPLISYVGNLERVGEALLGYQSATQKFETLTGGRGMPAERDLTQPWTWSALVLIGLMGLSLWILSARVRSLDRLK